MLIKAANFGRGGGNRVSMRCPACGNVGTFEPFPDIVDLHVPPRAWLGHRRCPNPTCYTHVFCIYNEQGVVVRSYPPQRIDFDSKGIPGPIVKSLSEALSCQAENLNVASAIMIRRTLEELCQDKNAAGGNLKERISALQTIVVLPKELFEALDDLRLLGNDAAHIEAKTYDAIGPAELEVAIALTKKS